MLNYLFTQTPLLFFAQSFWRDESFSFLLAKKNIVNLLILTARDFNPPLYYLILHFWMKVFGTSEVALRSLSLIFYWATVYVVFLFLKNVFKFSTKKSFFYLLFGLLNPLILYYAFEARMYSMLAFFANLSLYAFYKKKSSLYLISSILGLYTHYFMLFVLTSQIIYTFIVKEKKFIKKSLLALVIFIPWLVFVYLEKSVSGESFWIEKANIGTFLNLLGVLYTGYENGFKLYENLLPKLSLLFIALIIFGAVAVKNKLFTYLFLWAVVIPLAVLLISFLKPLFLPRYLIFSTIGLILLLIFILEQTPVVLRAFLLALILAMTLSFQKWQLKERSKADVRKTITEIKQLAKKGDVLYVTNELEFFDAQYYFDENRVYIYGKSYQEIPAYVGKILISKDKVVNQLPFYPKKAFILTSTDHYEIQAAF